MTLTIVLSEDEVALVQMSLAANMDIARETLIPVDPTAAAETKAEIGQRIAALGALIDKFDKADTWS